VAYVLALAMRLMVLVVMVDYYSVTNRIKVVCSVSAKSNAMPKL
jgi:hypothetical protein